MTKKSSTNADVKMFELPFVDFTYCLVTSEKEEKQLCKTLGMKRSMLGKYNGAGQCVSIGNGRGEINIVRLYPNEEFNLAEHLGLLAHEVNHIKRNYMEYLGERQPSAEFECYIIQELMADLTNEYLQRQ